jgi:hypothetical protein
MYWQRTYVITRYDTYEIIAIMAYLLTPLRYYHTRAGVYDIMSGYHILSHDIMLHSIIS